MIDPAGQAYSYGYEDATGNLTGVTFPDGMRRQYLYNEPALIPSLADKPKMNFFLTGIVDETAPGTLVRYATFTYEPGTLTAARPISSEHAGGVDKHTFIYNIPRIGAHYWRVVDPLGAMRQHHYGDLNGTKVEGPRSQPGGSGCGPGSANVQHDDNSNPISKTNYNGAITKFSYDMARNLEIRRVEASGTPQARTVSTEWHPQFRLPTRIAEPKRITSMSYDANSNLASKSVQPTADADGSQGFAAAPAGPARTWRYSFSDAGQLLSSVGPRNDSTSYSYSQQGELLSITNAAGHVTTLANYDPHGRPGRIVDANGLVTELTYSPRGWLTARTVGGQTTRYDHTGVGLLKTVTLPDGATLNYVHDDARRLLRVSDSVGGSIVYTLDNIGNRIKEQVIDPSGNLVRQTSREYDALNRLQQITGGQQ